MESTFEHNCAVKKEKAEGMAFEQVELRGASITTKAEISKGRSSVSVGLDAPLTSEAAAALGCQEKLFTTGGEVRPDLFLSLIHI